MSVQSYGIDCVGLHGTLTTYDRTVCASTELTLCLSAEAILTCTVQTTQHYTAT